MTESRLPTAPNLFAKKRPAPKRFHQYRVFGKPAQKLARLLRESPVKAKTVTRRETMFILPGRRDVVAKIFDDETFAMRRVVDTVADIELWEETAKGRLPLPRPMVAMVASHAPQMRAALSSFRDPLQLAKGLSRKTKVFRSKTKIEQFDHGDVQALVTTQVIDEELVHSVSLRCDCARTLQGYVIDMPVSAANQNIGDRLLAA